jgi:hypothetical protein
VTGGWRKVHNEGLRNSYPSPNTITMSKLKNIRLAVHVARMWRRGVDIGYWWESQKERAH